MAFLFVTNMIVKITSKPKPKITTNEIKISWDNGKTWHLCNSNNTSWTTRDSNGNVTTFTYDR